MDNLIGLKENVIIGKLIPAGTGYSDERETSIEIKRIAAQLKAKRNERNNIKQESEMMSFITDEPISDEVLQDMIADDDLSIAEAED